MIAFESFMKFSFHCLDGVRSFSPFKRQDVKSNRTFWARLCLIVYTKSNRSIGKMNFAARKLVLHSHSWLLGSRSVNLNVPTISIRYVHLFDRNGFRESKVTSLKQDDIMFQPHSLIQTTFFRYKSQKSNRGIHDDENSDDDSDSEMEALKSDRTLSLVKVQSLRLDSLIKGALGIPKKYFFWTK